MLAATQNLSTDQLRDLVEKVTKRGCKITVTNSLGGYSVRVRGSDIAAKELVCLMKHGAELWGLMLQLGAEEAERKANEGIGVQIERWRQSYTEEKGYDWGLNNWWTDYTRDVLGGTAYGYEKGECSMEEVRKDFKRWVEAHRRTTFVTVEGKKIQTVTPQIQPKTEDMYRLLRLLGMNIEEYVSLVQP